MICIVYLYLTDRFSFRFTPHLALKFGLIPRLNSKLLAVVNNFELSVKEYSVAAAELCEEEITDVRNMDLDAPAVNDGADMEMAADSNTLDDSEVQEGFAASSTPLNKYVV